MKKKLFMCAGIVASFLLVSCTGNDAKKDEKNLELEGVIDYAYYFGEEGMLISNQKRIMYSDWDNVEFEYICTDPSCSHTNEQCSSYGIGKASNREDRLSFSIEYDGKLIIFEKCTTVEVEKLDNDKSMTTTMYHTEIYEAKLDGTNRKHKLTMDGMTSSDQATAGVIVMGGRVYFGGPKHCVEITEYTTDAQGNEIINQSIDYDDALYCVDLADYSVKEYAAESNKTFVDYGSQIATYGGDIYYCLSSTEACTTKIYKIDAKTEKCELICSEDGYYFLLGALEETVYYTDIFKLYYRKTSDKDKQYVLEVPQIDMGVMAAVVGDKLAVMTSYMKEGDKYKIEYSFYNSDGEVTEKHSYNEYFTFMSAVDDKVVFIKVYDEQQMWWNDINDMDNILENATYIGSFVGNEHDYLSK